MGILDYASSRTERQHRRIPGRLLLAIALCLGVVQTLFPRVFGPIWNNVHGEFPNPLGIAGAALFVTLTIAAVRRCIHEEREDASAKLRSTSSLIAILATSLAFAHQFGGAPRTRFDDIRLILWGAVVLLCCLHFWRAARFARHRIPDVPFAKPAVVPTRFKQAIAYLRTRPDVAVVLCLLVAAFVFLGVPRIAYAIRMRLWYQVARTHHFPPMSLQFSTNSADKPQFVSGHYCVDPDIEREPFLGRFMRRPDSIFVHELRNPQGQQAVVCADLSGNLLDVSFIHIRGFSTTTIQYQRLPLGDTVPGGMNGIRIYSGNVDPKDPGRFIVPVQTPTVSGRIIVRWTERLADMREDEDLREVIAASISFEADSPGK